MPKSTIYATGATPEEAIRTLAADMGWEDVCDFAEEKTGAAADEWYYRFTAEGTSMKAAGDCVPGGVTLTWWK